MDFKGLEGQDKFAWALLNNIENGFYLDIACQHPIEASNTYVFEKELGWTGIGFDWVNTTSWTGPFNWPERRPNTKFVQMDVTTEAFTEALLDMVPADKIVDYVSMDVDTEVPGRGHLNLVNKALPRMINGGIRFKVMTLEHEFHSQGEAVRIPTRLLLESLGYRRLFSDVMLPPNSMSEDWWIDPQYFRSDIVQYGGECLLYNECVDKIQGYSI